MRRLVAVLGYSVGSEAELHPICAARLRRAGEIVRPDDVVLFTGWSRNGTGASEAELMAHTWRGPSGTVVLDRGARSTAGNAIGIGRAARALGVDEVVVVTSSWHGSRALTLTRAALFGSGARVVLVTTDEARRRGSWARELACWSLVPVLAVIAARARVGSHT